MPAIRPIHFLGVFVAVVFVIPATLIVPGTGAAGSPSVVLGLVALGWWFISRFVFVEPGPNTSNPVRLALFAYLWIIVLCWTNGKQRVLTALEATQSDRGLIVLFGFAGIALLTMDGLRNREEINRLARMIAWGAFFMAMVGAVQFFFHVDPARWIKVPGLVSNNIDGGLDARSNFTRPRGTALHPIEFGVVSAALIPIAYWVRKSRRSWPWLMPLVGLCFAAMISLSRSAVLAIAVAAIVMLINATWRERANMIGYGVMLVLAAGIAVNGLVGTIKSLFTQAGNDPSVQARVDRFPKVMALVAEHPWLGRGYGTYNIDDYFLLDNEIQRSLVEIGLVGVMVLVLFVFFVVGVAWRSRRGVNSEERMAPVALTATILALFISSYTFDAFFYRILTGVLYLCIGLVGALWRISMAEVRSSASITSVRHIPRERLRPKRPLEGYEPTFT